MNERPQEAERAAMEAIVSYYAEHREPTYSAPQVEREIDRGEIEIEIDMGQ